LITLTFAELVVMAPARSPAGTCALSDVAVTKVVVSETPFHCTSELERKLLPVTVTVRAALPAGAFAGESAVMAGTGFPTVNTIAADAPPPGAGFTTVTFEGPVAVKSVDGTWAVRLVALT
jgi:hypothetical protein